VSSLRRLRDVSALVAVGLALAACSTPPPSSAAQVGDVSISEATIFGRTSTLVQAQQSASTTTVTPGGVADVNRTQTTAAIRGQLLDIAAADEGVQVTDADVNAALGKADKASAASQLGVPESAVQQTLRDLLRLEGMAAKLPIKGAVVTDVRVRVDGVTVGSRDEAVATRSQFLADPAAVDQLIMASAKPVRAQPLSLLTTPSAGPTGVFNAAVGDVILYPSPDGYLVLRILGRSVEPARLTAAALKAQPISGAFDLGALLLVPYAQQAGVSVNPRLGGWDPYALQVVPGGSGL